MRYAHMLPLELAVELGIAGALLGLLLYATSLHAVWGARGHPAAWLFGPAVVSFPAAPGTIRASPHERRRLLPK